ncbi:MAG TPA: tRNA glutamyl-Q(34) synthetase GluQRS [Thermoanaerobaculia bacterium]|nr:tRNA glutamyl-Q(34) synthetase GluQRS [Thermoanaerobaculia bacterium]
MTPAVTGRFAPSPTGPLHFGSLVAATGSWLSARKGGGRWLVRIEDLDAPRVRSGAEQEILSALGRYGLEWDEEPVRQSERSGLYEAALEELRARNLAFDCACSRAELRRAASAPAAGDPGEGPVYPGTCRGGLGGRTPRAVRFRVPPGVIRFDDLVAGIVEEDVAAGVGDFPIRRADGPWAYQLAVVVDDAEQRITEVVRGGDLLSSTARQIALQRALGLPTPRYAHLPLVLAPDGKKLGKRDGALSPPSLDEGTIGRTLSLALEILGVGGVEPGAPGRMLEEALSRFEIGGAPRGPVRLGRDQAIRSL